MEFYVYDEVKEIYCEHEFELGDFNELELKLLIGKMYENNKPVNALRHKVTIKDFIQY